MKNLILTGLTAGAIQVAAGVTMYLAGVYFAPWSMLVSLGVLLACIVAGTRWYATLGPNGGISYAQALRVGVVISVSTGLVYAVYNIVSITFFYPHFLDDMVRARMALLAPDQQGAAAFAAMRAEVTIAGIAVPNLIRLSVLGSVLSLVSAVFLKRRPRGSG